MTRVMALPRPSCALTACVLLSTALAPAGAQVPESDVQDEAAAELDAQATAQLEAMLRANPGADPTEAISRPAAASREVAVFGFEEQFTRTEGLPNRWFRAQNDPIVPRDRPGFPIYNLAAVDRGVSFRGDASLRLPTQGGSTSLRLEPGALPVFPSADYRVSAFVRTAGLRRARAQLSAVLLDAGGVPIEASRSKSELVLNDGGWTPVSVAVWGDHEQATHLRIDLELLQPRQYLDEVLGDQHIWLQDTSGAAWFDEVTVTQLPRIELGTTEPTNIVTLPDEPTLRVLVRDLTGEDLNATVTVYDVHGGVAGTWERAIGAGRTIADWTPALTRLGWYRAIIEVRAGDRLVGLTGSDFVWAPGRSRMTVGAAKWSDMASERSIIERQLNENTRRTRGVAGSLDRERFAVLIDDIDPLALTTLNDAVRRLGVGATMLPMWTPGLTEDTVGGLVDRLVPVTDELLADWQTLVGVLPAMPFLLASEGRLDPHDMLKLFERDEQVWGPYVYPLLDRFGQRVQRWSLGEPGDEWAFWDNELVRRTTHASSVFGRLVPGPVLATPTIAAGGVGVERWRHEAVGGATLRWPAELPPGSFDTWARHWGGRLGETTPDDAPYIDPLATPPPVAATPVDAERPELTVVLGTLNDTDYGVAERCDALARSAIEYWRAVQSVPNPISGHRHRVALAQPWRFSQGRRPRPQPMPELAVFRNLIDRLAERAVLAELPSPRGVRAYVLGPRHGAAEDRGGALVVWREDARERGEPLEVFLGSRPARLVDIFGNELMLAPESVADDEFSAASRRIVHRIPTRRSPIFVEGVDVGLVRFLASLRVEPPFLPAISEEHRRDIVFANPFDVPMSGTIYVAQPGGRPAPDMPPDRSWTIAPRRMTFTVAPGEVHRVPMMISFNAAQESGEHDFVFDISLTADRDYGLMRMTTPVEIGLDRLSMSVATQRVEDSDDLMVEVRVVNTGEGATTLQAQIFAPGFPRESVSINELEPGNQTVRRFLLPGGAVRLTGGSVAVRVTELSSGARLNKSVPVP